MDIAQSKEYSFVVKQVREIKETGNHITDKMTLADLIQLGGYAAVEYCGGPSMELRIGRTYVTSEGDAIQHEAETIGNSLAVQRLAKLGLSPEEFVALMGSHTIGFQGEDRQGKESRWVMNPYVFDNTYYKELLLRDQSKYFKTESDMRLLQNNDMKSWVEAYAQDEELFFLNFAKAHVKLSEIGSDKLYSEFDQSRIIDGGYQEESQYQRFAKWFRKEDDEEDYEVDVRR